VKSTIQTRDTYGELTRSFNACPAFAATGAADPNDFKTRTDASLELISPCKEKPCLAALTKRVSDIPDCTGAMRTKFVLGVTRKVCEAFNVGPVSSEQTAAIRQKEGDKAHLSMLEQGPGVDDGTLAWNDTGFTLKDTALYSDADMPVDITTLSPVPCSSTPSPMTTPKSAASIATSAGVAAVTIAFGLGILS
jgi:hypothetical protein